MLYVLTYDYDGEGYSSHVVCEGPSHVNLDRLKRDFLKTLDPGRVEYPKYSGPMTAYDPPENSCGSGTITRARGDLIPDTSCAEYKQWERDCTNQRKALDKKRKELEEKVRQSYPGKTEDEMFISYLKKNHDFKEVNATEHVL